MSGFWRRVFSREGAGIAARCVLSGVFVAAGVLKLADMGQTQAAVAGYGLLPDWAVWPGALVLPWVEIAGGVGLWTGRLRRGARLWLAVLTVVFLAAVVSAWARGLDITCGCFGGAGAANYPWMVARDLGLLGLLVVSD
jgi:uncharacterized membrane protein YphA (DoxX/SURF4 family)